VIETASNDIARRRLEGLQFKVEAERKKARTPLAACVRISEMMCRSLAELHKSMVAPEKCRQTVSVEVSTSNVVSLLALRDPKDAVIG
jgi:hypothetical protein|tara:strand:+ start:1430 stop:1693 length:264 start_codon:yes stop_codon:yes gene_type:complete